MTSRIDGAVKNCGSSLFFLLSLGIIITNKQTCIMSNRKIPLRHWIKDPILHLMFYVEMVYNFGSIWKENIYLIYSLDIFLKGNMLEEEFVVIIYQHYTYSL